MSYECSDCGEEFNSKQALGGHKAAVHVEEVNCSYCGVELRKCDLKEHEQQCYLNPEVKTYCKNCGELLTKKSQNKFCSESCSISYNNKGREHSEKSKRKIAESVSKAWKKGDYDHLKVDDNDPQKEEKVKEYKEKKRKRKIIECKNCGELTTNNKYCSLQCCAEFPRKKKFKIIEENREADFDVKHYTNANWIKKYYIHKHGEKCMECGWDEENPHTGNVPIELDHIDGDHTNNTLENTRLLCPNCHSLTKSYKGANLGNGRSYRKKYYNKN